MLKKIADLWRNANVRLFTGALAVAGAVLPVITFAQEAPTTDVALDESIKAINIVAGLKDVGKSVAGALAFAIGLAAAIWMLRLIWRNVKSVA